MQKNSARTLSVLVVGGTGFIGRCIAKALDKASFRVTAVGRQRLQNALQDQYDVIVWAAGGPSLNQIELQQQHVDGPIRALSSLRAGGQFIYLSSGQVYGSTSVPFLEDAETDATSPYALAKLEGEACLSKHRNAALFSLTILRISLVYGPGQSGSMFIPSLLDHLLHQRAFITTAGEQTRDFIFVSDVANAVLQTIANPSADGLYNLGSAKELRLKDAATAIVKAFDKRFAKDSMHLLRFGERAYRQQEQMRYVMSMAKIGEHLGFHPSVEFDDGVARLVEDFYAQTG